MQVQCCPWPEEGTELDWGELNWMGMPAFMHGGFKSIQHVLVSRCTAQNLSNRSAAAVFKVTTVTCHLASTCGIHLVLCVCGLCIV